MRKSLFILLLVALNGLAGGFDKAAMCSSAKQCLKYNMPGCSIQDQKPNKSIVYNDNYCRPFYELVARGLKLNSAETREIFNYMGREYRIEYMVQGKIPVNEDMMVYLFEHMPFTAHLVNAYRGTKYTITYKTTDRRKFEGDNGSNLSGKFNWILQDSLGQKKGLRNIFFGYGRTKVMMWKLHGVAVVFIDLNPVDSKNTNYALRAIVFPANSFLNGIMKMDMFRNVVNDKIREIVGNIEKASYTFAQGNREPIAKYKKFQEPWLAVQLKEFDAVAKGSGYELGQAGKTSVYVKPAPKMKPGTEKKRY